MINDKERTTMNPFLAGKKRSEQELLKNPFLHPNGNVNKTPLLKNKQTTEETIRDETKIEQLQVNSLRFISIGNQQLQRSDHCKRSLG